MLKKLVFAGLFAGILFVSPPSATPAQQSAPITAPASEDAPQAACSTFCCFCDCCG